ncbi:hypothetical protein QLX08_009473 [Tetragonisca angustula]|uniref:Secreted protein n=1 Tax=Tetragonisca angustula TaxID=166442 RepID=A0AAW0ZFZ9_9HYME
MFPACHKAAHATVLACLLPATDNNRANQPPFTKFPNRGETRFREECTGYPLPLSHYTGVPRQEDVFRDRPSPASRFSYSRTTFDFDSRPTNGCLGTDVEPSWNFVSSAITLATG